MAGGGLVYKLSEKNVTMQDLQISGQSIRVGNDIAAGRRLQRDSIEGGGSRPASTSCTLSASPLIVELPSISPTPVPSHPSDIFIKLEQILFILPDILLPGSCW
jgi:hypothetical protein